MTDRRYDQLEPVAGALDLLGDRWTLLVVRELVLGPRRWTDLVHDLPGIGKNLLSARLRTLADCGVVRTDRLPWSSSATDLYRLGPESALVVTAVRSLARFGLRTLTDPSTSTATRPAWAALAVWAAAEPPRPCVLGFTVDAEDFTLQRDGHAVLARRGRPDAAPSTELTGAQAIDLALGRLPRRADHRAFARLAGLAA